MNVYLLYSDKDHINRDRYYDEKAIVQDLGLTALFSASAREIVMEGGKVKQVQEADPVLEDAMKRVMLVPLETEQEILYRQEIVKDCLEQEDFIRGLYELSGEALECWEKLGRRASQRTGTKDSARSLITEIHVMRLFVTYLKKIKELFREYSGKLHSEGLVGMAERLEQAFGPEREAGLENILKAVAFYADKKEGEGYGESRLVNKPRIVLSCGLGEGLKPDGIRLQALETQRKKRRDPNSTLGRAQDYFSSRITDSFSVRKGMALPSQTAEIEYEIVRYVINFCQPFFDEFSSFFDRLRFQAAFYRGAVNLKHCMERFGVPYCYPKAAGPEELRFQDLKEFVMCLGQRANPVGNTCEISGSTLLVVTGANQGGKSTFLRSIGVAQVMMQCGLPVTALNYESGIFTSLFTHFTRREDSEMNSGRLDEELGRMSRIVDHLGPASLVLLNESFASTTEKEGAVIAYDVVRALTEAGVKVLTVTHLLSFAQRVFQEAQSGEAGWRAEFLSAQRTQDGRRTYKMIPHAPELTSFGLDLYDEIIGKDENNII